MIIVSIYHRIKPNRFACIFRLGSNPPIPHSALTQTRRLPTHSTQHKLTRSNRPSGRPMLTTAENTPHTNVSYHSPLTESLTHSSVVESCDKTQENWKKNLSRTFDYTQWHQTMYKSAYYTGGNYYFKKERDLVLFPQADMKLNELFILHYSFCQDLG